MDIVADTSAIMAVIVGEPERDGIVSATSGRTVIAPGSVPWEVGNAFSAMLKRGRVDVEEAQQGLRILDSIPLRYVSVDLAHALSVASDTNTHAYDAYFLHCALRYAAPLLTLDRTLAQAAGQLGVNLVDLGG